jgi:hypothetical protein
VRSVLDQLTFTTEHQIHGFGQWSPAGQFKVPFDRYLFRVFAFAVDPATNHSPHIAMFAVTGTLGDFVLHSQETSSTSKFTYGLRDELVTAEVESRSLHVDIKRSTITWVFAISLSLINWSLAVGSTYITALVAHGVLEVNRVVVTLPFSAAMTIPTIRSLYAGSQPFGNSIGKSPPSLSSHN